jgi:chemotaxis signal transduction protein
MPPATPATPAAPDRIVEGVVALRNQPTAPIGDPAASLGWLVDTADGPVVVVVTEANVGPVQWQLALLVAEGDTVAVRTTKHGTALELLARPVTP